MIAALAPSALGVQRGAVVLDIGCADGRGTEAIAEHGYSVLGVELEPDLLSELRRRGRLNSIAACQADATSLPIADGAVDAVVMVEILEHISDTRSTLAEARRVVQTGGRLCIAVPTGYTERIYSRLHPRYLSNAEHIHRFSRQQLTEELEAAGLIVTSVATRNLGPAVAWLIHAALRNDADATGRVLRMAWIDSVVAALMFALRRVPVVRRGVDAAESRFGKSWYFYAVAA